MKKCVFPVTVTVFTLLVCAGMVQSGGAVEKSSGLKAKAEPVGKAVSLLGKVLVRSEDSDAAASHPLRVGDSVYEGQVINTSSDANAKILLSDHSVVDIGASTLFKIDEFNLKKTQDRNVEISMNYGRVRTVVSQPVGAAGKFKFRTRTATMGVRGTEFVVQSDLVISKAGVGKPSASTGAASGPDAKQASDAKTQITVVEGKVEVTQPSVSLPGAPGGPGTAGKSKPILLTPGSQMTTAAVPVSEGGKVSAPEVKQLSKNELQQVMVVAKVADRTFVQNVTVSDQSFSSPEKGPDKKENGAEPAKPTGTKFTMPPITITELQPIPVGPPPLPPGPPLVPPPTIGQPVNVNIIFSP